MMAEANSPLAALVVQVPAVLLPIQLPDYDLRKQWKVA